MRPIIKFLVPCALVVLIGVAAARIADTRDGAPVAVRARAVVAPSAVVDATHGATETPQTSPSDPVAALPGCIPVADFAGETVGCALKAQLYPATGSATRRPPKGMPGFPVYAREGGAVVGYEVTEVGYVPAAFADDRAALGELTDCMRQLNDGTLDGSPALTGCAAPLRAFGIQDPVTEAHDRAVSLGQIRSTEP